MKVITYFGILINAQNVDHVYIFRYHSIIRFGVPFVPLSKKMSCQPKVRLCMPGPRRVEGLRDDAPRGIIEAEDVGAVEVEGPCQLPVRTTGRPAGKTVQKRRGEAEAVGSVGGDFAGEKYQHMKTAP